jgi:hypothetical protein
MKKIMLMSSSLLLLAGCATPPAPVVKVDKEPILVGIPMGERVAKSAVSINEQVDLLNKVNAQKYVGTYEMVEHNNGLDARKGSSKTLPQSYANKKDAVVEAQPVPQGKNVANVVNVNSTTVATNVVKVEENKINQKVKKIDWSNESANELGKLFAKTLGYEFVLAGNKDVNISVSIENETIESAIAKYKTALSKVATVVIIDKNKTFNVIYK